MSKHPLDDTFDVHRERLIDGEDNPVRIPEKELRDLDLIIDLALRTYEEQINDIQFIEPKNRIKYLEIAERFLNQAKDAMAKRDKLLLDREKFEKGGKTASKAPEKAEEDEDTPSEGVSRQELQRRTMKRVK